MDVLQLARILVLVVVAMVLTGSMRMAPGPLRRAIVALCLTMIVMSLAALAHWPSLGWEFSALAVELILVAASLWYVRAAIRSSSGRPPA